MRLRIVFVMLIFCLCLVTLAGADPKVSFTFKSGESRTVLSPVINGEVSDYKWTIVGKNNNYYSDTGWIPYTNVGDHTSILDRGTYFVTIAGRNITTGQTDEFTNEVIVRVKSEYVKQSQEQQVTENIGSRIINSLPEPLKSFFLQRSGLEMALIIFGFLLLIAIVTRRKKVKKYVELKRYEAK